MGSRQLRARDAGPEQTFRHHSLPQMPTRQLIADWGMHMVSGSDGDIRQSLATRDRRDSVECMHTTNAQLLNV